MKRPLARSPAAWIRATVSLTAVRSTPDLWRSSMAGSADSMPRDTIRHPACRSRRSRSSSVCPTRTAQLNCNPSGFSVSSPQSFSMRPRCAVNRSS